VSGRGIQGIVVTVSVHSSLCKLRDEDHLQMSDYAQLISGLPGLGLNSKKP
jgi:hypothetical protein